MTLDDLEVL